MPAWPSCGVSVAARRCWIRVLRETGLFDGVLRHFDAVAELHVTSGGDLARQAVDFDEAVGRVLVEAVAGIVGGEVVILQ